MTRGFNSSAVAIFANSSCHVVAVQDSSIPADRRHKLTHFRMSCRVSWVDINRLLNFFLIKPINLIEVVDIP